MQRNSDILIAGAGIVGLALALELNSRGARVTVLERDKALSHASSAAAGMLAANDPHNPPQLLPLSQYSLGLYPNFLARIQSLSGIRVPIQTEATIQYLPNGSTLRLAEQSLDPRQLAVALLAAVRATSIDLREHSPFGIAHETSSKPSASPLILTTGAWSPVPVVPRKGQMLRIQLPVQLPEVYRSQDVYIVPRTLGPQAGTALIGATDEDAGFDTATHPATLAHLRALAAKLLPQLASEADAPQLEVWAGLRPATPDSLPILGRLGANKLLATGHYRNGILLAPATALVMAQLISGENPSVNLAPFSPARSTLQPA